MPFTPFHFGPSALIGLPLKRWIDIPVFVLANVVIDFEPLAVMVFRLDYPLHGYFHTLLIGGVLGLLWGLAAYPFRPVWRFFMGIFGLSYQPTLPQNDDFRYARYLAACIYRFFSIPGNEPIFPFKR